MQMDIFSVSDKKRKDVLYVQLNSIKTSKNEKTNINYYLLIDDLDQQYIDYFKDLQSDTFHISFINASSYKSKINPPQKTYLYYLRCLAPSIFPSIDKILYLDTDIVAINVGIEELWNTDISTKYLAGATDIQIQYNTQFQMLNVKKSNNYFNSGVMLMNLKRMRENDIDKILESYLYYWPKTLKCILYDQTLLNYVIGNEVKIISSKWNNSILSMVSRDEQAYKQYYETDILNKKIKEAVLIHMKGPKPQDAVSQWAEDNLPNRKLLQQIYGHIYNTLAKHESF